MKKYLMTAMAAVAMGVAFTSCSHNTDLYGGEDGSGKVNGRSIQEQLELDKAVYKAAFEQTFGKVAPAVDWGFGSGSASTRAFTRAIQPSFNFPNDADASKFLADVPQGVEKLTQNVASANNWIDATWQGDINIWGNWDGSKNTGGTLYIKGNCDFSNRSFYFAGNSELYIVAGATLTLGKNNGSGNLQTYTNIYIAEGAKLVAKGELKLNNGLHIFNHGTIETDKLSTNSDSWLVNGGTVNVAGKISVENTESVIENNGTITAADLNTAGSGKFENNADVTITGTTFVNSNDNTWVNNGQYHTGNFIYNAASDEVINNCRLTVDEDFNINLGDNSGNGNFKMDAGSGVVTKYFNGGGNWAKNYSIGWNAFNGGPFYIYMGANSVFKVTETATMNATKADYGIYGPTEGGYAVFQAKNIVNGANNQGYEVTYGNNLYVSAESHFANGWSGQYPYIDIKGNAKIYAPGFEDGKPTIKIEETTCNPGFEGDGDDSETYTYRVIVEDLSASQGSDFDFNDVVFDVDPDTDGQGATIKILAAGGIWPLTVAGQEVHQLLIPSIGKTNIYKKDDVEYECYPMINTGVPEPKGTSTDNEPTIHVTGNYSDDTNIRQSIKGIVIKVFKYDDTVGVELQANKGEAACKVLVDKDFGINSEYNSLATGNHRFKEYVTGRYTGSRWWADVE